MTTITNKMKTKDINKALKKGGEFHFAKGIYKLTEPLVIYSNTVVVCEEDVIFERHHSGRMVYSYCKPTTTKYNGIKNVSWKGGRFIANTNKANGSVFVFFHADNIILDGISINGCVGLHSIEINACQGVTVKKCSIANQTSKKNEDFREAIQIDFANLDGLAWEGATEKSKCYDGTHCNYIGIYDNEITNCPVGIGTHTVSNDKKWHEKIEIIDNLINECEIGVRLCGFKDTKVIRQWDIKCVTLTKAHKYKGGKITLEKPRGNKNCKMLQCENVTVAEN